MEFLRFDDLKGQVVGIHVGKLGNIWKHFNDPDAGHKSICALQLLTGVLSSFCRKLFHFGVPF